jgi:EAL and modified HD-GYP domain-containing signal transduction protein
MIDVLMDKPFEEVFLEIEFSEYVKGILTGKEKRGFIAECYNLVLNYEKGKWDELENMLKKMMFSVSDLNEAYLEAIKWLKLVN